MKQTIKQKLYDIIFETDTRAGKFFDISLIVLIMISVAIVILESVEIINNLLYQWFNVAEWIITILFTIEFLIRTIVVKKKLRYLFSFYGIIDLLAILPNYFIFLGSNFLIFRALRLLRIFRIFKLSRYLKEANLISKALKASFVKLSVFIFALLILIVIIGSTMYFVEGKTNGFDNIPKSIYWAIVTLTTVGYGDMVPITAFGKFLSSLIMILGYSIIAVPTGIVTVELSKNKFVKPNITDIVTCKNCLKEGHDYDAKFCKFCGVKLV